MGRIRDLLILDETKYPMGLFMLRMIKKIFDAVYTLVFIVAVIIAAPFGIEWVIRTYRKDIPASWIEAWREVCFNVLMVALLFALIYIRRYLASQVVLLEIDILLISLSAICFWINLRRVLMFLILPRALGAFHEKLDLIWKEIKGFYETIFQRFKHSNSKAENISKRIEGIIVRRAVLSVKEVMVRLAVIVISLRFLFVAFFFLLSYAGIYHYSYAINPDSFLPASPAKGYLDFIGYSLKMVGSFDSGLVAQSVAAKVINISQITLSGVLALIMLPLLFLFYERNISYSEQYCLDEELMAQLRDACDSKKQKK